MFVVALIEDDVKIMPQDFRNEIKTIEEAIERKFCGKVLLSLFSL
jgi:DNA-directed RNA polymerase subunit E'/Rpb7